MELFDFTPIPSNNLLPKEGCVIYYGKVLNTHDANLNYNLLLNEIDWRNDEAKIFGKTIITKRKVAWYGDKPFQYSYSNTTKLALGWTPALLKLKQIVETTTQETYNSCLLNLYHNGSEGMAWHSDGEKDIKPHGAIASMSFGAERKFAFKHKITGEKVDLVLPHGSLLVMKNETQSFWLHRLPPTTKINTPRINLTFRSIVNQ